MRFRCSHEGLAVSILGPQEPRKTRAGAPAVGLHVGPVGPLGEEGSGGPEASEQALSGPGEEDWGAEAAKAEGLLARSLSCAVCPRPVSLQHLD